MTLNKKNIKVAIVMGSNSDYSVMRECEIALKKLTLSTIPKLSQRIELHPECLNLETTQPRNIR